MNVLLFLVKTFTDLYLLAVLLRLLLQFVGADFYNPFSQFVFQVTEPLVRPLRRIMPRAGRLDSATLILLILLEIAVTWLLIALLGVSPPAGLLLWLSLLRLVSLVIWAYTLSILVYVILGLIAPGTYNPIGAVAAQIADPVVRPFRRVIPIIGGLDFSPMIALILLFAASIALGDLGLDPRLR